MEQQQRRIHEHNTSFFSLPTPGHSPHVFHWRKKNNQSALQLLTKDAADPRSPVKFYSNPKPCNSPVMFFIHQMIPGSEGNQVCVICWCRDGNWTSTAYVRMTQLVGKNLQLIWRETIVIPEDVVMWRSACSLKADHILNVKNNSLHFHLWGWTATELPASPKLRESNSTQ